MIMKNKRIIISGGGTGGHIFPAISIANSLKEIDSSIEILFVGAEGKMEMEKVPLAGYEIKGLPVAGLQRNLSPSNLKLPIKVIKSILRAKKIIKEFKPDCAVGVGGYASAPLLWSASHMGVPCLIQEQNSYAGLTNKIVSKRAKKICTAYEGMEKFFPSDKIILTGNPIRNEILQYDKINRIKACEFFGIDPTKPCIFIVGGSLGCGTFNKCMQKWINDNAINPEYQIIWQSGKAYKTGIDNFFNSLDSTECKNGIRRYKNIINCDFVSNMDYAYSAANIIISRAGAGTISELCCVGKACIFVPSPIVAEDHQTHNAMALVNKDAALIVKDSDASNSLLDTLDEIIKNNSRISILEHNIKELALPQAGKNIALEILKLIDNKK